MQILNYSSIVDPEQHFNSSHLEQTVKYYETIIARGDERSENYWNLGLAYLLRQQELDAQATWFIPFDRSSELEAEALSNELVTILDRVACQKFVVSEWENAWLISQHLREVDARHIHNLLRSILLAIKLDQFTPEILTEWEAVEILLSFASEPEVNLDLFSEVISSLLAFPSKFVSEFIQQCLWSFSSHQAYSIEIICKDVLRSLHNPEYNSFIVELLEICRELQPKNTIIIGFLCEFACISSDYEKATALSLARYDLCNTLSSQIIANYSIVRTLLSAGDWRAVDPILARHARLLELFVDEKYDLSSQQIDRGIIVAGVFLPCVADKPDYYRPIQNKISQIYLKHDRPQNIISVIKPASLSKQAGVRDRSDMSYCFGSNADEISAQIYADEIDILIDLDSLTLATTCKILANKPAPIQVSWLGWDATGLPTVDYFIADRYVLPDNAQDYYQEKIWRLPQSYLAVDGFEVGIPTISRESLDIPSDAIVY